MAFYKRNGRNAYIFDWYDKDEPWAIFKRNELLHHDSIIVDKDMYPKTAGIYWGWNICFKYHNYHFLWQWDNTIYLTDEEGTFIERKGRQRNGKDDYFVINMGGYGDITQTGFLRIITKGSAENAANRNVLNAECVKIKKRQRRWLSISGDLNHYFEAGILTDDSTIVELAMDQFGSVWNGSMCKKCKRKQYCADPISKI